MVSWKFNTTFPGETPVTIRRLSIEAMLTSLLAQMPPLCGKTLVQASTQIDDGPITPIF